MKYVGVFSTEQKPWQTINIQSMLIEWKPTPRQNGTEFFCFCVSDKNMASISIPNLRALRLRFICKIRILSRVL